MRMLVTTNLNGRIKKTQEKAKAYNTSWVICVGNFGTWPDPRFVDRATKEKGIGEFPQLYTDPEWSAEVPMLYISGPNENHKWLHKRFLAGDTQVLPNVHWLAQGYSTVIGGNNADMEIVELLVGGLGKVYSEKTFNGIFTKKSFRQYTRKEVERACSIGKLDLLITYEGIPSLKYNDIVCKAQGIDRIIFATRPALHFHYGYGGPTVVKELNPGTTSVALEKDKDIIVDWNSPIDYSLRLID